MAEIALVTVLFNSNEVLEGFFESLSMQTFVDYHLYLIDNTPGAETDKLLTLLLDKYKIPAYSYIRNDTNVGIAKGNNQGVELSLKAGCKYTLVLNNDIEFYNVDLLQRIHSCAVEQNESLLIPKIFYHGTNLIWMAGGKLFKYSGKTTHVGDHSENESRFNEPAYFEYAPTCFMLINNAVFKKIGLFDESYFVYYDDTDFMYRAIKAGYKIYYMPQLEVMHKVSTSTGGGESIFTIFYCNRNRVYFLRKNLNSMRQIIPMLVTLITRLGKSIVYNKQQRSSMWRGVIEGFKM